MTTETTFTLPTENSTITNKVDEFLKSLDLPLNSLGIILNTVRQRTYGQFNVEFTIQFEYLWMDDNDLEPYKEHDDFTVIIPTNSKEYYHRLRGIDEDCNYDGCVADAAEIEFIENHMDKILESIEYKLRWFFRELR